jgi:hypothetical protein
MEGTSSSLILVKVVILEAKPDCYGQLAGSRIQGHGTRSLKILDSNTPSLSRNSKIM